MNIREALHILNLDEDVHELDDMPEESFAVAFNDDDLVFWAEDMNDERETVEEGTLSDLLESVHYEVESDDEYNENNIEVKAEFEFDANFLDALAQSGLDGTKILNLKPTHPAFSEVLRSFSWEPFGYIHIYRKN